MDTTNAESETHRQTADVDSDPTLLVPPEMNTTARWDVYGVEVTGRFALAMTPSVVALAAAVPLWTYIGQAPGLAAAAMSGVTGAIGYAAAAGTDYDETTARDRIMASLRTAWLARALPLTHAEAATPRPRPWPRLRAWITTNPALRHVVDALPFGEPYEGRVHGVRRLTEGGLAETDDGRLVGMVRLEGRNTDLQTAAEERTMIGRLRTALDEDVRDVPFRLYSTSLDYDAAAVTEPYRRAWDDTYLGERWRWMREYLRRVVEWEETATEEFGTREWRHYAVVSVAPKDVTVPTFDASPGGESRLRATWRAVVGSASGDAAYREQRRRQEMRAEVENRLETLAGAFQQTPGVTAAPVGPAELATVVARRWSGVSHDFADQDVTDDVDLAVWPRVDEPAGDADPATDAPHRPGAVTADGDLDAEARAGATADVTSPAPGELAPGSRHAPDGGTAAAAADAHADPSDDDALAPDEAADASILARIRDGLLGSSAATAEAAPRSESRAGTADRVADLLAPSTYDASSAGGFVRAGEQFARTYWVAAWPPEPDEKFLRELYTLRGVDVEVNLRCDPVEEPEALERVKDRLGEGDADIADLEEASDYEAVLQELDMQPNRAMYELLHNTPARAWELTGYVTVRAGTRCALERAEEVVDRAGGAMTGGGDDPLDVAKYQALETASENVRDTMERSPARVHPVAPAARQDALFKSAGPVGRDVYAETSARDRSALTLSGTLAAAFPPAAPDVRQDNGILLGHLAADGAPVAPDPFDPGPAHQLFVGDSGSGKTTFVAKKALRWWAQGEDRTLILCDTMGEFSGLTELCNGEQITLDGSTTINPLHIEETPADVLAHLDVEPFEMKFQEAAGFILDVITDDPRTADRFKPLVKDALRVTYREAGVDPRDPLTHRPENAPDMTDYRATVEDMGNNPEEYVTSRLEAEEIDKNAGELLRRLSGFTEDGEMRAVTGQSEAGISAAGVTYLDLQQIEGLGGAADKSTTLMLMLGQVYQAIKRSPGEAVFVIDEAHYLLQSEEMLAWLQQAARHWRHYDAGLWFVSQHPDDFVEGDTEAIQEHLDAIRGQTTATTFFATDDLGDAAAEKYGLNAPQRTYIRARANRGEDDVGHTDALMAWEEREGWHHVQVRLPPLELAVVEYDPATHGDFAEYLRRAWERQQRQARAGGRAAGGGRA